MPTRKKSRTSGTTTRSGRTTPRRTEPHTLEWYLEVEQYRYGDYAPWMFEVMEFGRHGGDAVLEIGGGLGTDLSQFARHGAQVTDVDLSGGHLAHAQENFALRGLDGHVRPPRRRDAAVSRQHASTSSTATASSTTRRIPPRVVQEIQRVLKPGGKAIVMMYAEHSWHYWYRLVWEKGLKHDMLRTYSIGEIMSRHVEITENDARPLVKVYTGAAAEAAVRRIRGPRRVQAADDRRRAAGGFRVDPQVDVARDGGPPDGLERHHQGDKAPRVTNASMDSCLYVASNLGAATTVTEAGLAETTERHRLADPARSAGDVSRSARRDREAPGAARGHRRDGTRLAGIVASALRQVGAGPAPARLVPLAVRAGDRVRRCRCARQLLAALDGLHRRSPEAPRDRSGVAARARRRPRDRRSVHDRLAAALRRRPPCPVPAEHQRAVGRRTGFRAPACICEPTTGCSSPPAAATATPATSRVNWRRSPTISPA